jgi:hypothetical protein
MPKDLICFKKRSDTRGNLAYRKYMKKAKPLEDLLLGYSTVGLMGTGQYNSNIRNSDIRKVK